MSNPDPNQQQDPLPSTPISNQQPIPTSDQQPAQRYVQPNTQAEMMRAIAATKSFVGPAILTLALYWFTFWIGGIIANVVYLNSANNAERLSGVSPEGKGCLWILLITHVVLPVVGFAMFFLLMVLSEI